MVKEATIGAELARRRREAGLTQSDVALRLEMKQPTVSQWEGGEIALTSARAIQLLEMYEVEQEEWPEILRLPQVVASPASDVA